MRLPCALKGISWTTCRKVADDFGFNDMKIFGFKSYYIIEAKVCKDFIVAYINYSNSGRNEHEVIIEPSNVINPKKVKYIPVEPEITSLEIPEVFF